MITLFWVINRRRTATILPMWLTVLSAILGIITFLPLNPYPVVFVFLVPLFIFFLREKKFWRLITGAFLFRLIFLCGTVYFTLEPILWTEVILIFLGLPVSIFLFKKFVNKTDSFLQTLIFLPFAWTFFDLLQAQFSLIPTYIITAGNALGSSPFLGLASVGGFITLTFFVALINILIAAAILQRKNRKNVLILVSAVIVLLLSGWQISNYELRKNAGAYANLPNSIGIAVISANGSFSASQFWQLKQELSASHNDLVVFPEDIFNQLASFHFSANNFPLLGNGSTLEFQNLAKELRTNIIASYDTVQNLPAQADAKKYGSVILFDAQGNVVGIHNKNRLTFIGEYWPFGNWHPSFYKWLRTQDSSIGTYAIFDQKNADTPGERNLLSTTLQNPVSFAAPICLEIQYPYDLEEYRANGARFIINQSSNRWTGSGLNHFLYLTDNLKKIEAVWLKLPIVSSGVNDFAGVILPDGQMHLIDYQTSDKNYNVFFGTVRY